VFSNESERTIHSLGVYEMKGFEKTYFPKCVICGAEGTHFIAFSDMSLKYFCKVHHTETKLNLAKEKSN
jgi:hypothetical protein